MQGIFQFTSTSIGMKNKKPDYTTHSKKQPRVTGSLPHLVADVKLHKI